MVGGYMKVMQRALREEPTRAALIQRAWGAVVRFKGGRRPVAAGDA